MLKLDDQAPDFTLKDQNGRPHRLSDYKGKWVVLYFYPKDNTPGCTKEACSFRDQHNVYHDKNIVVLGISKDSVSSHARFADRYALPFTLLSDPETKVIKEYGAWQKKKMFGKEYFGIARITYLINPEGNIEHVFDNVKPDTHAKEILMSL